MRKIRIISDGSCDLPEKVVKERDITVVPFYVTMDEKTYLREGVDISPEDFYRWMVEHPGSYPKSSMPSTQDFADAFTAAAGAGEDIICICITQKFSSSYQTATAAKHTVEEEFPDIRITVVDSIMDTVLQGIYVLEAANLRDAGLGYDDILSRLEAIKPSGRIFFTVGSIEYLRHGGRIGKLAGIAGTALGIRPIITLKEGEIFPSGIARSRTKSIDKAEAPALAYIKESFRSADEVSVCVGYGYDREEGIRFRDKLTADLAALGYDLDIPAFQIGATIGVHTGPHPLGLGVVHRGLSHN